MADPVVLWESGVYTCVIVHNWGARNHEVRILMSDAVVDRRWFHDARPAADFAIEAARQFNTVR